MRSAHDAEPSGSSGPGSRITAVRQSPSGPMHELYDDEPEPTASAVSSPTMQSTTSAAPLQLEAVLEVVLSSAGRLFLGEGGSVMLLVGPDELEVVCSPGNRAALGARVRFGEGVAGKVAATCDPVLVSGRAGDRSKPVDSAMSVPLMHDGRIFGVLNINARADHSFSEHDLAAATDFCRHAADAIANAQRYEADRRGGAPGAERHLVAMLDHLARAGNVDFVEPRDQATVDAAAVVRDVAEAATADGRATDVKGPPAVPVRADAGHLRRALDELVDNGHVHGAARVRMMVEAGDDAVTITIADGGSGIPATERSRVFDPYVRLEAPNTPPGLGLGLTIARRLVEACGGSLAVEETPVGGTAAVVTLPRH